MQSDKKKDMITDNVEGLKETLLWPKEPKRQGKRKSERTPYVLTSKRWEEFYAKKQKEKEELENIKANKKLEKEKKKKEAEEKKKQLARLQKRKKKENGDENAEDCLSERRRKRAK